MKHQYGDFSKFTTLYRELDESYILSDDGSTYPESSEEPELPEPTLREIVQHLQTEFSKNKSCADQASKEITDIQIALCEIYEMIKKEV